MVLYLSHCVREGSRELARQSCCDIGTNLSGNGLGCTVFGFDLGSFLCKIL
jgi:hypothetical protein